MARGTSKTVRWYSPGCTYVDVALGGASLASNHPNTGYAVVTIPESAATGASAMTVNCKSAAGVQPGVGQQPESHVCTSDLRNLLHTGCDDVFNTGDTIFVAGKKSSSVSSVAVEFSSDGGASFSSLPFRLGGTCYGRVTLPAGIASTANAIIRISSGSDKQDATDGF